MLKVADHIKDQCAKRELDYRATVFLANHRIASLNRPIDRLHIAVRLTPLAEPRNIGGSEGDEVWGIIREGVFVTVMYRWARQSRDARAMDCDLIVGLKD